MANLSFYAQEIDDILGRADKATAATALTSTDTLAGLGDGLYTATAEVASAISDSPVSVAFTLRVLADMYILILADGSDTYTGAPGAWHKSSSGEDTTARAAIAEHIADKSNPHEVTKAQVGLGNVDNVATKDVLAELVDSGAKNLLKITVASQTIGGVTFTVNDDGTVTVDGTNTGTGSVSFMLVTNQQATLISDGDYWLSGCPQGGGTNTFDLRWFRYSPNASAYDIGSGAAIHKNGNTTDSNIAIVVRPGVTVNNITFKPMLCTKAAWDISQEFVPYRPSYDEIVARIEALEGGGN